MLLVLCWLLRVRAPSHPPLPLGLRGCNPHDPSRAAPQPASAAEEGSVSGLDRALNTLCDAFLFFDTEGRGSITRADVDAALGGSGGGGPGAASGSMRHVGGSHRGEANAHAVQHAPSLAGSASRRRFSEMDFDHNGRVSFPEFVAALESWAGVEEEE